MEVIIQARIIRNIDPSGNGHTVGSPVCTYGWVGVYQSPKCASSENSR